MATSSPPEELQGRNENHVQWLLRRIWDRINRQNDHFMGVIVGQEGSGKSYTAIKIGNTVDPSFTADRVIFDVTDLLEVLKDGKHEPGQFYVLDEAGVQFGVRTWQERGQVLANQALQLIRNHNLGLLFTLPRLGELDSQAQGRLQAFVEMTNKIEGEYAEAKWKWLDPDRADDTGKIYKKYPRRRRNGNLMRVRKVAFTPPEGELIEEYEERKRAFQEEFYQETIDEMRGNDEEDPADERDATDIAEEIMGNGVKEFVTINGNTGEPYVDSDLIRLEYDTTHRESRAAKKLIEKEVELDAIEKPA